MTEILKDYTPQEVIHSSRLATIYRGIKNTDNSPVILKVVKPEFINDSFAKKYRNEFTILKKMETPSVVKALDLIIDSTTIALVLEPFSSRSLSSYILDESLDIAQRLKIAIHIAGAVGEIHQNHIIHKDIKPHNILIDKKNVVKIIDFGIATSLAKELPQFIDPEYLEGTLFYISPEQTARMARVVDYRSDIYSLGVTLFELFTGKLPFVAKTPIELVHLHITQRPPLPSEVNPAIPKALSEIILKCMEKNIPNRYKSAFGLKLDLEKCLSLLNQTGSIPYFTPGEEDFYDRYHTSEKIFGREKELQVIKQRLDRVWRGEFCLLEVSGYSGIGKSSLVMEARPEIQQRLGRFAHANFDQFKKNIPYYAISHVIKILIHQMLMESESNLAQWKERLLEAVGINGQIVIDLIPDVKLVIGEQPSVEKLPPQESENRFKYVMSQFIRSLPRPESPLVVQFDDFQWCDDASLKLLKHVLIDSPIPYFFVIITYRDNEVTPMHPLRLALKEIQENGIEITNLCVKPLETHYVEQIILEVFSKLPDETLKPFSKEVGAKTHGNPFFVIQFLKYLYDKDLINFDRNALSWKVNLRAITSLEISDNVVDLLIEKLKTCDPEMTRILKICSVIGNRFELSILTQLVEEDESILLIIINEAFQEEFITQEILGTGKESKVVYRFTHDRIQQAFYSLLDKKEKTDLHYRVGKGLLKIYSLEEVEDALITIVNHLNYGLEKSLDKEQKKELLELNLRAGIKVKEAQAFVAATTYLRNSAQLLDPNSWETQYEISFTLYNNLALALQLSGNIEDAEKLYEMCLSKAKTAEEKAELYTEMIYLLAQIQEYDRVFECVEKAYKVLDFPIDLNPSKLYILYLLIKLKLKLSRYTDEDLRNLPLAKDKRIWLAGGVTAALGNTAFKTGRRPLLIEIALKMSLIALEHGITPSSVTAFAAFALVLSSEKIGDYEGSYKYGLVSTAFTKKLKPTPETGTGKFGFANWVYKWKHPIKNVIPLLWDAYHECMQTGNIPLAATSLYVISLINFLMGEKLEGILDEINTRIKEVQKQTALTEEKVFLVIRKVCQCLLGQMDDPTDCCPDEFYEELQNPNFKMQLYLLYYFKFKGLLLYLFDQFEEAKIYAYKTTPFIEHFSGIQSWPLTYLCSALSLTTPMKTPRDNKKDWNQIHYLYKYLEKWAKAAPMNYAPHAYFVQGEIERIKGRDREAVQCYQKAIQIAKNENNTLLTAMGYEVIARFYIGTSSTEFASYFLEKAVRHFSAMSAFAKVHHMETLYSEYLEKKEEKPKDEEKEEEATKVTMTTEMTTETQEITSLTASTSSSSSQKSSFDLNTIIQASQSLSKEINFDKLMASLMQLMVLSAGATKASLILLEENRPLVYTEISVESTYKPLKNPVLLIERGNDLSIAIIDYVIRTRTNLVLNHIQSPTSAFHDDDYVVKNKPKSVLSLPLIQAEDLKGILYLENSESEDAFTPRRLHLLSLLSSQMAISIENAQFYSKLENKVEMRTRELQEKNTELQDALKHIKEVQEQLIQQEKLASLGLLTAGIAHELKNPLNFVINFSQIAKNHLEDLLKELESGNKEEQTYLITQLVDNLDTIDSHGMRANNIIKGMLSHSHQGTKDVEQIDINAIIEQGLGLSIYSFRKKNPDFNLAIEKHFGEHLPMINGYSGELMRVIINIVDNGCYAMAEKLRRNPEGYEPKLEVTTVKENDSIKIIITDNGTGIPQESIDKIFNPFFTNKPAGSGTGLGLSISYDIIVKQHKGTIIAHSEPNVSTEFIITLPA